MAAYIHRRTFRVVMSEVDVAQIHFTNAFRWMDRGLSEWLAEIGHPFTSVLETGPGIPIVDARCAFLGRILARRGDPEAAALIDRSWRLASATGEDQKMAIAAGARIERLWLEGDEDGVRADGAELL